jgi:hypothetical protein
LPARSWHDPFVPKDRRALPAIAVHGIEERCHRSLDPSAVTAAVGAAEFVSARAVVGSDDTEVLVTAMCPITGSIETEMQADQRGRGVLWIKPGPDALDCGASRGTFA